MPHPPTRRRRPAPGRAVAVMAFAMTIAPAAAVAGEWPWTAWDVGCVDPDPCAPADEVYEPLLEHASSWLDDLGFGAPKVTVKRLTWDEEGNPVLDGRRVWYAEVDDSKNAESVGIYYSGTDQLFLRGDAYFTLGEPGEEHDQDEYGARLLYQFTPVHELFHAVQNGYQDIAGTERDWIWEGSAAAVQKAYSDAFEPELGTRRRTRRFDDSLHRPASGQVYGTWLFWRDVGRQIGSPSEIQYLREVLAEDLEENLGLDGVDRALKRFGGLYRQYPRFLAGLGVARGHFGPPAVHRVELARGRSEVKRGFPGKVRRVAGKAAKVEVSHASDQPVEVEISFVEDHPDLHLIVDGQVYDHGTFGAGNRYEDLLLNRDRASYEVIVADVATEAGESRDLDYQLQVTLREVGDCAMTARVTGDVGGSYFGDVAHFSTEGGATIYGTFSNPEAGLEVMRGFLEMAEQMGAEVPPDAMEEYEDFAQGAAALPRETFGLSLSDQKLGEQADSSALATLVGGFTLEASLIGTELGERFTGTIPLSSLSVVPGPRAESTLDKVRFVWAPGSPGNGHLALTRNTGGLVAGRVSGTVYAEGYSKPDGSRPVIQVEASFVALPGPTGCLLPGMPSPF